MKKILTKPILIYTILFFGFFIIATIPSQIRSNTFFGFGLFTDGFKQHLIFMRDFTMHIKDAINGMGFEWFRYDLGLGGDFITSYTYYSLFDPLTFIAYLVPNEAIEFTYYLIAILRLYLCGLVVMWCAKTFQIKHPLALISTAIFYVFNVTVIYSALRHPMFVNGPLLFPLIIIGAERLFRHQNPALLIVGSFLSLITQFYFFMFVCVGFELFVIIRLLIEKKDKTWKEIFTHFFYVNIMYLLGALCAGFILFPQFIATLNSGRIAGKGIIFYDALDYTIFFASYLVPVIGGHYTSAIGNMVVFFIVIAYIRIRPKTWESILFLVLSGMMLLSVFGYMFNLFSYVNNRWTFLMMLPTAMILGKTIDQPEIITKPAVSKASQVTLFVLVLIGAYGIIYAASLLNQTVITLAAIGIAIVVVLLLYRIIFKKPRGENLIKHFTQTKLVRLTLITSFSVVAIIASVYFFTMTSSAGLSSYEDEETFALIHEDTSYYRVEQKVYALGTNYLANDNLVGEYNSTYSYNTMGNGYVNQVISYYDVVNLNSTAGYNGFNNRSALMGINHVKYVIIRDSEATPVPYGFTLIGTTQVKKTIPDQYNMVDIGYLELENGEITYENASIYRNDSFIPFGFVYHEVITKADLEALNPLEREQILLKAALVEEEVILPTHTPTTSIEEATPT
ncbi:MAG: YfhO family protein, partial [Bacilli bacterium]|nr:YfhO family protein [Bacilli bacterium]